MPNKNDRVIIDTNLWIRYLISKTNSQLDSLLISKQTKVLFSEELLSEFTEVSYRPKFRKYFSIDDIKDLLISIHAFAEFIDVKTSVSLCRDTKDNFLLALSLESKADFLITSDYDLLTIKNIGETIIITLNNYLKLKGKNHK